MPAFARPPVPVVVLQHVQDSAALRHVRTVLVRAPHVKLHQLQRLDERLAAHLDGLAVAGPCAAQRCAEALERPGVGEVFAAAALAIEAQDAATLDRLIALAGALPEARRGLLSALGWVSGAQLKGIVSPLLTAADPLHRSLGLGACRMHHVDPGSVLAVALGDADLALRTEALRCASELGRIDLLPQVQAIGAEPALAFHAALAACLLGDRSQALDVLSSVAQGESVHAAEARNMVLQAAEHSRAQTLVRELAKIGRDTPAGLRKLVRACGILGDPHFVPWLIDLTRDDTVARLAGESLSMITGADLAALDLERKPPEGIEFGPNADPLDQAVALDEDESLPWPEHEKLQAWWRQQAASMPAGGRFFVGAPPTPEQVARVLREGFQRQRIAAARQRCLNLPGSALFSTAAPAWRQQRRVLASAAPAA